MISGKFMVGDGACLSGNDVAFGSNASVELSWHVGLPRLRTYGCEAELTLWAITEPEQSRRKKVHYSITSSAENDANEPSPSIDSRVVS